MTINQKILLVDDDPNLIDIYQTVLTQAGFAVDVANNGEDGLIKAGVGGYDLILLDMVMPKMTGLDLLKGLKEKYPKVKNGKIIVLTNLPQDDVIKEALANGATAFLIKADLTPHQFVDEVKKFLA